jgi:hypothetical protein
MDGAEVTLSAPEVPHVIFPGRQGAVVILEVEIFGTLM